MSYRANVVLGIFLLKRWVSIITLFCNLFYIRNTSRSYLTSERICIEYSRSSKFVSPSSRAYINGVLQVH